MGVVREPSPLYVWDFKNLNLNVSNYYEQRSVLLEMEDLIQ